MNSNLDLLINKFMNQNNYTNEFQVDVLIPTRDRTDSLPLTLLQLSNQITSPFRVIIRDEGRVPAMKNSSVHYAINILKEKGNKVIYWRELRRKGNAFVRNQLLKKAAAPYILFIDDDTILLDPNILASLLQEMRKYPASFCCAHFFHGWQYLINPEPLVYGYGFGCILMKREWLLKAGGFSFYKTYGRLRRSDLLQCRLLSSKYGMGRSLLKPGIDLEISRTYPRRLDIGLKNTIDSFAFFWIKETFFPLPQECFLPPHSFEWESAALELIQNEIVKTKPQNKRKSKSPISTKLIHQYQEESNHRLLDKLFSFLLDPEKDIYSDSVLEQLSWLESEKEIIREKFRSLLESSQNPYILTQAVRGLMHFGKEKDWKILLKKALSEQSLLKFYIVHSIVNQAPAEFILKQSQKWTSDYRWQNKLCALLMINSTSLHNKVESEKIAWDIWEKPDSILQWQAVKTLAKLKKLQKLDQKIANYHSLNKERKSQILWLLGECRLLKYLPFLVRIIQKENYPRCRVQAAWTIGRCLSNRKKLNFLGPLQILSSLVNPSIEPNPLIRAFAVFGLFEIEHPKAWEFIIAANKDPSDVVQSAVVQALANKDKLAEYFDQILSQSGQETRWYLGEYARIGGRFDWCQKFVSKGLAGELFDNNLIRRSPHETPFHLSKNQGIALMDMMEKGRPSEKFLASWLLGFLAFRKDLKSLFLRKLRSSDWQTRLIAAYLLSTLKDKRCLPTLIQTIKYSKRNGKLVALCGIIHFKSEEAIQILKRFIHNKNIFLQMAAVMGLVGNSLHRLSQEQLHSFLKHEDVRMRLMMIRLLSRYSPDNKNIRSLLRGALRDPNGFVRREAFKILTR